VWCSSRFGFQQEAKIMRLSIFLWYGVKFVLVIACQLL
jgi:hypothetical protein